MMPSYLIGSEIEAEINISKYVNNFFFFFFGGGGGGGGGCCGMAAGGDPSK